MTASLTLLALGLKAWRRWSSDICCVGAGEGEVVVVVVVVVVVGACGARVWDSSSMVEGSMVVVEVLVVDEIVAVCLC